MNVHWKGLGMEIKYKNRFGPNNLIKNIGPCAKSENESALLPLPYVLILNRPNHLKKLQKLNEGKFNYKIGQCFSHNRPKGASHKRNEVLTEGDGQADPRKPYRKASLFYPNLQMGKFTTDCNFLRSGEI